METLFCVAMIGFGAFLIYKLTKKEDKPTVNHKGGQGGGNAPKAQ